MNYNRSLDTIIKNHFSVNKEALLLIGPRQVGKTTLIKRLFPQALFLTVDNEPTRKLLDTYDTANYRPLILSHDMVVIDEVQLLANPGRAAKLIYDQFPQVRLILTGSSTLQIKNNASESMAGRYISYELFPLSFEEYLHQTGITPEITDQIWNRLTASYQPEPHLVNFDRSHILDRVLLYGLYPATISKADPAEYLLSLAPTIAIKDLLEMSLIQDGVNAFKLLKLLAYQIGNLVNINDLANRAGMSAITVKKYLYLFEQSYIIYSLLPYHQSGRDEIGKATKVYFCDTGIRNALIEDFSSLELRPDRGQLFENFMIMEAVKANRYMSARYRLNYWRTTFNQEVDLVLSKPHEDLMGVEVKYQDGKINRSFRNRYPKAITKVVTSENFY